MKNDSIAIQRNLFKLPSNVKQIGRIKDGLKIYLEDYVHTYLYQYAKNEQNKNSLGVLIGRYIEQENEKILLIHSAIKYDAQINKENFLNKELYFKEAFKHIQNQMKIYYKDENIVGLVTFDLVCLQNEMVEYNKQFEKYNIYKNLKNKNMLGNLIYVIDNIEKTEDFFVVHNEKTNKIEGHFIYYDKNEKMQKYMNDNKLDSSTSTKVTNNAKESPIVFERYSIDRVAKMQNKELIKMLSSLSAVLFLICLVMGIGLIENVSRINKLENNLVSLNKAYKNQNNQTQDAKEVFSNASNQTQVGTASKQVTTPKENTAQTTATSQPTATPQPTNKAQVENKQQPENTTKTPTTKNTTTKPVSQKPQEIQKKQEYKTYTIKKGESLITISYKNYKNNSMVKKIMELNNIKNQNDIKAGQVIKLPVQ